MTRTRRLNVDLLIGEWAVLGLLNEAPSHGFALSRDLSPNGDIGRIWSLSRPLTYRAIDQLLERDLIETLGELPGRAGGNKTIYSPTSAGRSAFQSWVTAPVPHLRELRSELLLKLVLARRCSIPVRPMIADQRSLIEQIHASLQRRIHDAPDDLVLTWRLHSVDAARRFLDDLDTAAP